MVEGAIRDGAAGSVLFANDPATCNRLQRIAVVHSRLGIPLLMGFDVIHGLRTIFPVPIGLAASWEPSLLEDVCRVAAREARAMGIHWTFAPMLDIARDPRWGRIVEGAGEDPYLAGVLAAAQVRGFQGDLGSHAILAGPKHFAGYGAARGGRDYDDVEVSDSELWNVYLAPFRAAIEAGARNVMSAYMELNGVPASGNRWLLTEVLRGQLGFDGFVVSDANAVRSLETQHFASDQSDAAIRAVSAGLDMEMAMFDPAFSTLERSVAAGRLDERTIDDAVRRVLAVKFELGLFEDPWVDETAAPTVVSAPEHRQLADLAATRSIVLLENSGVLPLDPATLHKVAVIGQLADSARDQLGPWVFDHVIDETVTILDGLRARLAPRVQIDHLPGAGLPRRRTPSPFDRQAGSVPETPADHDDDVEIERAVALAAASDVVIVVVGERQNQIGELASRSTLALPGRQQEQLERLVATGVPVVVVVMSGRPLDLAWAATHAAAIVQAWYPGTRGGDAVARVLAGDVSPAGRLPFSWPRHVGQVPLIYSHMRGFQPETQSERYWNEESTPLYPFGHGLSYARFEYSGLRCADDRLPPGASTTVSVDVANVFDRDADEVVQLYLHLAGGSAARPHRELKGFRRVHLRAGEATTVHFTIGPRETSYWSAATRGWAQDARWIDVWVGGNCAASLGLRLPCSA